MYAGGEEGGVSFLALRLRQESAVSAHKLVTLIPSNDELSPEYNPAMPSSAKIFCAASKALFLSLRCSTAARIEMETSGYVAVIAIMPPAPPAQAWMMPSETILIEGGVESYAGRE